jgi:hypothetical protein
MSELLLDAAGRRRSPATMPGFHAGRPPRNKGLRYPADPPTVEEIVAVVRGEKRTARVPAPWADRGPLASGTADPRGARARRGRPGPAPRGTAGAARQGRSAPRSRHGRVGVGATTAVAPDARRVARRSTFLRPQRPDARAAVVMRSGSSRASPHGSSRRSPPTLCPAPAAPCTCCRNGSRGRATDRDPTPARPQQPRHHVAPYRASTMLRSSTLSTPGARP